MSNLRSIRFPLILIKYSILLNQWYPSRISPYNNMHNSLTNSKGLHSKQLINTNHVTFQTSHHPNYAEYTFLLYGLT
jgi:hypothetical protein